MNLCINISYLFIIFACIIGILNFRFLEIFKDFASITHFFYKIPFTIDSNSVSFNFFIQFLKFLCNIILLFPPHGQLIQI